MPIWGLGHGSGFIERGLRDCWVCNAAVFISARCCCSEFGKDQVFVMPMIHLLGFGVEHVDEVLLS